MAVIIKVEKSRGFTRTCDERCYNAQGRQDLCNCICQGYCHGKGLEGALEAIKEHAIEIMEANKPYRKISFNLKTANPEYQIHEEYESHEAQTVKEYREERDQAVTILSRDLKKQWNELVEEAKRDLEQTEEDWITYRYALLLFAIQRIPPSTHSSYKFFKRLLKLV